MTHRFLFLDSNVLLHYKFFNEIDWCKIAGADTVELVIPCTVISTLDTKKYDSADSGVRERSRKAIARLSSHKDGSLIRENVTLCLLDHEPQTDFAQWGLSRESEDDRIIAEILLYREGYPDRQIAVVTGDAGLTLKCRRRSIPILEIPEDCRLPDRLDPQAKQIKELQAKVAELESRLPKLRLCFSTGENWLGFKLVSPEPSSQDQIERRLRGKQKVLEEPLNQWRLTEKVRPAYLSFAAIKVLEPTADDWQRYSNEVEEYLPAFESYLKEEIAYKEYLARRIKLSFTLDNDGTAPAEDIDVFIHFDGNFEVVLEEGLGEGPTPPKQPVIPSRKQFALDRLPGLNTLYGPNPGLRNLDFRPSNVSGFTIRKTNSEEVSGHIDRIKQKTWIGVIDVYVTFPSITEAKPFTIDYILNTASLPHNVTGELHVKIEHE